ncbi:MULTISPECIES: hypothetical protein [Aeromonas]|uniref:Uncharacterized protein n=1 Tax=Aeromonas veronii AMC34 TaxID=1073383 RepID=K1IH27_AERVE|nr:MULTISPECIES: hypothetical protein [Aeromonas]EKB18445.1 hypothetical protein HMPREF1168_03103 [Aeromonas veronii AMC34]MCF5765987.1 hypothetical protein [Aeromonas veronii]QXB29093.1 hypothetical protein I6L35_17670 [Aeromonas sp. FDAARGOS 1405]
MVIVGYLLPKHSEKAKTRIFGFTSGFAKAFQTPAAMTHVAQYIHALKRRQSNSYKENTKPQT